MIAFDNCQHNTFFYQFFFTNIFLKHLFQSIFFYNSDISCVGRPWQAETDDNVRRDDEAAPLLESWQGTHNVKLGWMVIFSLELFSLEANFLKVS